MSILRKITAQDEFTGWHMIGVLGLFFGTIISVNMALAYFAASSWTGLVVKNSYVESQRFNTVTAEREASRQLGWRARIEYQGGVMTLELTGPDGKPADASAITAMIGRPSSAIADRKVEFTFAGGGVYSASTDLADGIWEGEFTGMSGSGVIWHQAVRFTVDRQ